MMTLYDFGRETLAIAVRIIGLVLLLFGIWLALAVLNEAWDLYNDPTRIERFAQAIERGSNIDRSIAPLNIGEADPGVAAAPAEPGALPGYDARRSPAPLPDPEYRLRLSYFIAWIIALLLLLLLARISLGAVRTGGELVLYETQMKRFARELIKQSSQGGEYRDYKDHVGRK